LDSRARTVRFWTAVIIYAGAGLATVELLLAVREQFHLPEALIGVIIAIFLAGLAAMILLLRTSIAAGGSPILHGLRAFSVVLIFVAFALLVAYWLSPESAAGAHNAASIATPPAV